MAKHARDLNKDFLIASVENYGNIEGNYAQLEPIVLRDLQQSKGLFKNVTFSQVMTDPILYRQVVDAYWNRMEDFGVKDPVEKAIWWLMPGRYKSTGGDINKLQDPRHRNIMANRIKNLNAAMQPSRYEEALSWPAQ